MGIDRLMAILLILINEKNVTGKRLAEHFEVSLRTIYRDIEKLCEAGVPVAATGGVGGGYYLMEGYKLDKAFVNHQESVPLLQILQSLNRLFGKDNKLNDLMMKFQVLRDTAVKQEADLETEDKLRINLSHFSMEQELRDSLGKASKAIDESLLLQFEYVNRRKESEIRLVEPYSISFNGGEWYLWAFCRERKDFRNFKLVRMRAVTFGNLFQKRELSQQEMYTLRREGYYRNTILCKLRFNSGKGLHLGEHFDKDSITLQPDGSYIVEEQFPNDEGLLKFILSFGLDCEVLEPPTLRDQTIHYLETLTSKYKDK